MSTSIIRSSVLMPIPAAIKVSAGSQVQMCVNHF